ncbi:MAG: hypothetical protein K0S70_4286, partial [Microbacterium sp.]|nr:hypothetical protein [Microbacterium sp.]
PIDGPHGAIHGGEVDREITDREKGLGGCRSGGTGDIGGHSSILVRPAPSAHPPAHIVTRP